MQEARCCQSANCGDVKDLSPAFGWAIQARNFIQTPTECRLTFGFYEMMNDMRYSNFIPQGTECMPTFTDMYYNPTPRSQRKHLCINSSDTTVNTHTLNSTMCVTNTQQRPNNYFVQFLSQKQSMHNDKYQRIICLLKTSLLTAVP